jgi:hypothetical protein
MLLKMVYSGVNTFSSTFIIGSNNLIELPNDTKSNETAYKLVNKDEEFIPEQFSVGAKLILKVNQQIAHDGCYQLKTSSAESKPIVAFNYDRKESVMQFFNTSQLTAQLKTKGIEIIDGFSTNLTGLVAEVNQGIVLWKWCVLLALLFLLAEVLLLRFWKK